MLGAPLSRRQRKRAGKDARAPGAGCPTTGGKFGLKSANEGGPKQRTDWLEERHADFRVVRSG